MMLSWMARCQRYPGQVLRPSDPPYPCRWAVQGEHPEPLQMRAQKFAAALGDAICLVDHRCCIANQFEVALIERVSQFERVDQREPLGLGVGAVTKIVADMRDAPHDGRHLDRARIGPAPAVEENSEPPVSHLGHP